MFAQFRDDKGKEGGVNRMNKYPRYCVILLLMCAHVWENSHSRVSSWDRDCGTRHNISSILRECAIFARNRCERAARSQKQPHTLSVGVESPGKRRLRKTGDARQGKYICIYVQRNYIFFWVRNQIYRLYCRFVDQSIVTERYKKSRCFVVNKTSTSVSVITRVYNNNNT